MARAQYSQRSIIVNHCIVFVCICSQALHQLNKSAQLELNYWLHCVGGRLASQSPVQIGGQVAPDNVLTVVRGKGTGNCSTNARLHHVPAENILLDTGEVQLPCHSSDMVIAN